MTLTLALTTSGSRASYLAAYNIHYGTAHTTCTAGSYHHHLARKELDYYYSFLLEHCSLHCWSIQMFLSQPRPEIEALATQPEIYVLWGQLHHNYAWLESASSDRWSDNTGTFWPVTWSNFIFFDTYSWVFIFSPQPYIFYFLDEYLSRCLDEYLSRW